MPQVRVCATRVAGVLATFAVAALAAPAPGQADDCIWDGSTGNWNEGAHWSCGHEPGAGDSAQIGSGNVSVTAPASVDNLDMTGGLLQGGSDLTVTVSLSWSAGMMDGTGKTVVAAGANLSISGSSTKDLRRDFDNGGAATWSGTGDVLIVNATFSNLGTGTLTIQNDERFGLVGAVFNNDGAVIKTGAGGQTDLDAEFNQSASGTVEVQSGVLELGFAGTIDGILTATGATLRFVGAGTTLTAGATITATNVEFTATTTLELGDPRYMVTNTAISGGVVSFDGAVTTLPNLTQSGGTLSGSGNVAITNALVWTGGLMDGTGETIVPDGATLSISGPSAKDLRRDFDNGGAATWSGTGDVLIVNATFSNLGTGTLTIQNDERFGLVGAVFNNDGAVIKTGGGGQTDFDAELNQSASGSVEVQDGILDFGAGGTIGGTLTAADTTVRFSFATASFADDVDLSVTHLEVGSSNVDLSNITDLSLVNLSQTSGTLTIDHPTAEIRGDFSHTGGTFVPGKGRLIFNGGTEQNLSLSIATQFFVLEVSPGTTLVETNATDHATVSGFLRNQGVIRKTQPITGAGVVSFGLTDIELNVVDAGTLTEMRVDRIGGDHPSSAPPTMPDFYWQLTPTGAGATADVTLYHCYQPDTEALLCRWTGGSWDCGNDFSTQMSITRQGMTEFGDWSAGAVDPMTFMTRLECGGVSAWTDVRGLC